MEACAICAMGCCRQILLGVKDSLSGLLHVFHFIKQNEKIRNKLLKCFFLNGVVLWLSVVIFEFLLLPVVKAMAELIYARAVASPFQSGILDSMGTVLWYVFACVWVLPLFWISRVINMFWFQDIASASFKEWQRNSHKKSTSLLSQGGVSFFVADALFSVIMEFLFIFQDMIVSFIPVVGTPLSVFHLAILYSLYSFEYKWIYQGMRVEKRVSMIQKNWSYFFGFGLPLSLLTVLPHSLITSVCMFAMGFPVFIITATVTHPPETASEQRLPEVPIFRTVIFLTNKFLVKTQRVSSSYSYTRS